MTVSTSRNTRRGGGLALAVAVLVVVAFCSVAYGTRSMSLATVWDAFWDYDAAVDDHLLVRDLRVPRTVIGLSVGAALGLGGAVMQGLTRNPLADPGIFGVEAGAALAVVVGIYVFNVGSLRGYVWFGLVGAAVASVAVYVLGSAGYGGATPIKMALAGAAMSVLLMSIVYAVILADTQTLDRYRQWVVGSLAGRDGDVATQVLPFLAAGALLALGSARTLNAMALGEDMARALGQRVQVARAVAALAIVVLVGAATAAAGPIAFVGLAVPHMARAICGPDYRWILPWSLVLAPTLLLGADVLGRVIDRPSEVQVGVVTAVLGAPFFIFLVRHRKLAEL